ncbi:glycosyltransferase [Caldichromatium japonicum]|uniref:Glycosyltransferase n=1 Tax=Caldichromatium japonicum TaxID=2699430 RepID=A0A6G7VFX7_9GAMM|nr:glycosyltransferase [Caldichromatium japonicum]QIK38748.1 glycosyltransferase [Caldichromatium japonicum]
MKILHVEAGRHLYGGARQVLYLVQGLKARGHDNLLVCPLGSVIAERAAPFAQVQALPLGGDLDVGLSRRLLALIKASQPDLIHLHSRRGADLWGGLSGRLGQVPVVLTRRVDNPEQHWLVPLKYRLYDRVIAISQGIYEVLLGCGVPQDKLRVVRSAIDPAAPERVTAPRSSHPAQPAGASGPRARLGLAEDALVIGMIAQLIPRKGHQVLLAALPELIRTFPRLQVLCFGQGPLSATLAQEISSRGLSRNVRLMGFHPDLPELLPAFDLLVHPALKEGLGIALLEAAAAGLPIVATRVGGIPEAVRHGVNGLLVPPEDPQALAAAIAELLQDRERRRIFGQAGQALVACEFSVEAMVEGNLAVYRELIP